MYDFSPIQCVARASKSWAEKSKTNKLNVYMFCHVMRFWWPPRKANGRHTSAPTSPKPKRQSVCACAVLVYRRLYRYFIDFTLCYVYKIYKITASDRFWFADLMTANTHSSLLCIFLFCFFVFENENSSCRYNICSCYKSVLEGKFMWRRKLIFFFGPAPIVSPRVFKRNGRIV